MKHAGKTIVFVSHDLKAVEELCDEVVLLHNGRVVKQGEPAAVISEYHKLLIGCSELQVREEDSEPKDSALVSDGLNRWGSKEIEILEVIFLDKDGTETNFFKTAEPFRVRVKYLAHGKIAKPVFGIAIYSDKGVHITGPNTKLQGFPIDSVAGKGWVEYRVESLPLLPGTYIFSAAVYDFSGFQAYDHCEKHWNFHVIESEKNPERYGLITIASQWKIETEK